MPQLRSIIHCELSFDLLLYGLDSFEIAVCLFLFWEFGCKVRSHLAFPARHFVPNGGWLRETTVCLRRLLPTGVTSFSLWWLQSPVFMIPVAPVSLRILSRYQTGGSRTKWRSRYSRLVALPDPLSTYHAIMLLLMVSASSLQWFWQLWTNRKPSNGNCYR